jgi:hypothetical protein
MTVLIPENFVKNMTFAAMALYLRAALRIQVSLKLGYEETV